MTTVAKKTRKDKPRTCRLSSYCPGGEGLLRILIGSGAETEVFIYYLSETRTQTGGRLFHFVKGWSQRKPGQPDHYDVHISPTGQHRCECPGWLRWQKCKHVACALTLISEGRLPEMPVCKVCHGTGEAKTLHELDSDCLACGGSGEEV